MEQSTRRKRHYATIQSKSISKNVWICGVANRMDVPEYLTIIGNMVIRRGDWSIRIQVWEVT